MDRADGFIIILAQAQCIAGARFEHPSGLRKVCSTELQ